jgi:hypothetical protein
MKTYIFHEPHVTGGHATVEINEEQILEFMNEVYKNTIEFKQLTDKQKIDEFIVVHWCEEKI